MDATDQRTDLQVLLVEDNPFHLRMVRAMLAEAVPGAGVVEAGTMAAAVEHLDAAVPDCVLLDLMLPDARGSEAVAAVAAAAPEVPIVVLSAHDDADLEREALAAGARHYLVKGVATVGDLRAAVTLAVGRVTVDPTIATGVSTGARWTSEPEGSDVVVSVA